MRLVRIATESSDLPATRFVPLADIDDDRHGPIRALSLEQADALYEMRLPLEEVIGIKAARDATPEDLADLSELIDRMARAATKRQAAHYAELNFAFHDRLARAAGNPRLHETYSQLVCELAQVRRRAHRGDASGVQASLIEHLAIHAAISAGRSREAADLLIRHTQQGRMRLHRSAAR